LQEIVGGVGSGRGVGGGKFEFFLAKPVNHGPFLALGDDTGRVYAEFLYVWGLCM